MKLTRQALLGAVVTGSSILPLLITYWIVEEQISAEYPWWSTGSTIAVGILTFCILLAGGILTLLLDKKESGRHE